MSTPAPTEIRPRLPGALWAKLLGALVLCIAVAAAVPQGWEADGDAPPASLLLLVSALVTAVCGIALYWGIRADLSLPRSVALYAVGFNALVVVVKFALGPHGLYEVNRTRELTGFLNVGDDWTATGLAAAFVLALYAAALWLVYRLSRPGRSWTRLRPLRLSRPNARTLVVVALVGALLVSGAWVALLALLAFSVGGGAQYVSFVFSSSVSLLVGLTLAGAAALAALAFRDAGRRAAALGDASLLVLFFWLALFFLALYHVVWVVYVLVLVAVWPLRVVVPK